jgi:ferredoxin
MERLERLAEDYAILRKGPGKHNCIMEYTGTCPTCESYQDMAEELWMEMQEERRLLPGYLEAQSKLRLACTCREMDQPIRIDLYTRIVALAMLLK